MTPNPSAGQSSVKSTLGTTIGSQDGGSLGIS